MPEMSRVPPVFRWMLNDVENEPDVTTALCLPHGTFGKWYAPSLPVVVW